MVLEVDQIKADEGFRSKAYRCPAGKLTIGYGTNLEAGISQTEATALLEMRLDQIELELMRRFSSYGGLPATVKGVLLNMSYQMGVDGVLKFKDMLSALRVHDWAKAADAMLDSKWSKQTPSRAKRLSERVRNCT